MSQATTVQQLPESGTRGLLLVFLAGILWSTVGLGIRLIEDALVWQILLYRSVALSLLIYVVIRVRTGQNPFERAYHTGIPGVVGGLSLVAAYAGGIYAIQTTSVANAMLLFASAPFMAAILGLLILREAVQFHTWLAIMLACLGIAVMVWDKSGGGAMVGNLAALGSAFGFAVFTITLRWGKSGEMLPSVFLSGLFAIPIMAAICIMLDLPLTLSLRDSTIAGCMGIFQVGAGLILYTIGSKTVPAAELTLVSLAEVVLAPLWVWLVLGESATFFTLVGGAILLLAIAGNAVMGARRKPPITLV
ncbi:DMT family transporter [uncultured Roseovarius sp.]|uniref:DMT family transporter n=1 Tax=uncultured Roseovarius sp. TaxID=293344 RepID=UPI00260555F6|nr:DMT family transporter [uncultured Roseovarius sp.]